MLVFKPSTELLLESGTCPRIQRDCSSFAEAELKALVRRVLESGQPEAICMLSEVISYFAQRTAHGGSPSEREDFVKDAPVDILFARSVFLPSRLTTFDTTRPFLPWLRSVLRNLFRTHIARNRRAMVNSDLVGDVAERAPFTARCDLPELSDGKVLTPSVVSRLKAATNTPRLLVFLAVAELHSHYPDWEPLVRSFERMKGWTLPRPFPSLALDHLHTPRTRIGPLSRLVGYTKTNTLTQTWRRACHDIRSAFPDLDLRTPTSGTPTPNAEHSR